MNNYELMVIFTPVLSDDEFKTEQKKFAALVSDSGGSIVSENPWGLKSLAYPIQKKTTGLYWVLEYSAPSDFNEKLKIQLLRDERNYFLRFHTVSCLIKPRCKNCNRALTGNNRNDASADTAL